ncbi:MULTISPECIES: hypothetical protein [unclassified Dehalobacter]|uniref:hypothetical protein n=1 Tax=unclassified Dehalobacter TaxID=2635733 RepID=UPI00104BC3CB|nr:MULTISPECIES: hypothetical protein [unclassified Dehalobacter]TCX51953.1 hypothetical protein C1I36_06445 [Dehalobacter sp. 14DCB1]TCX53013.1 hypothetical protein C1I38_08125 [Dehalobacter sp. 12DCB1]
MLTKEKIDGIRQRCNQATPGPWYVGKKGDNFNGFSLEQIIAIVGECGSNRGIYAVPKGGSFPYNDKIFIAEARTDIPLLLAEIYRLQTERDAEKTCEYKIHTPSEEGYPDREGYFYRCTCGVGYIDTEQVEEQEWSCCPYCGGKIKDIESLSCMDCEHKEWDGDDYVCENKKGKNYLKDISNLYFAGCKQWQRGLEGRG